ncbi:MAG TPA: hypothetical protein DCL44_06895 [Elusimicrobia bacterium]|nr:hypothetical protein [Elusimicrobiota bacterium]
MKIKNEYKFIVSVTLMFLLPFSILSAHFLNGARELLTKNTLSYLELRTRTASGILSSVLSINYDLTKITAVKEFYTSTTEGKKSFLERRMKENPSVFSEFSVLNSSGREIARAGAASLKDPKDYSKEAVFNAAVQSAQSAGAVEFGDYTPPALVLIEPISSVMGAKPDSFLLGRLSLAYLGELARLMGRNSWGNFGLLDGGGQIIADSMGRSIITPGLKAPPEVLKMAATASDKELTSFMSEVFFRGRTYLVSVSAVGGTQWWVYEIMDAADMPAYTSSAWARRVVFSGIGLIIMFGFISYKLARIWLVPAKDRG